MASRMNKQWPAQQPPAGFADATVEAILHAGVRPVAPRRSRWRVTLLALAAALAAGTCWAVLRAGGWTGFEEPARLRPVVAGPRVHAPVAEPEATGVLREAPRLRSSTPRVVAPRAVPSPAVSSAPAAAASSAPPRPVVVPRCECGPATVICTCVQ